MKIAVVGLGSMGKRRIRLLNKINMNIEIFGVDGRDDRRNEAQELNGVIKTFSSIVDLFDATQVDACIICTAPLSHSSIILAMQKRNVHVFTEINLVSDGYKDIMENNNNSEKILFLSSTFLYREETRYIKEVTSNLNKPISYTYHVGQYLPDWHPWESFKDFFVNDIRTNGCREIFSIEMPWLIDSFGSIESVLVNKGNLTNLDIDYPDFFQVIIRHKNGNSGVLSFNIVSRKAVRNLEVYSEKLYLSWDGSPTGLWSYDYLKKENINISLYDTVEKNDNYSSTIIENAYTNELIAFLNSIQSGENNNYGFSEDLEILEWIDVIENAS